MAPSSDEISAQISGILEETLFPDDPITPGSTLLGDLGAESIDFLDIMHQMEKAMPHKTFIGAPGADGVCNCNICPYMALNTMEKLYACLRDLEPRIEIEEGLRLKAKQSLDRMLEMASGTIGKGDLGKV